MQLGAAQPLLPPPLGHGELQALLQSQQLLPYQKERTRRSPGFSGGGSSSTKEPSSGHSLATGGGSRPSRFRRDNLSPLGLADAPDTSPESVDSLGSEGAGDASSPGSEAGAPTAGADSSRLWERNSIGPDAWAGSGSGLACCGDEVAAGRGMGRI
ncbi:hypothetical protein EYF80_028365 [Liparis tanakae]|uniref:Uncharacterized protein n=1 Tax=Liparis tanakae TaxID=230148 RepID=A0A4Z2H636_9TELE|nr:hypothetical protein EYF80_028365 [Liparis tanakae]